MIFTCSRPSVEIATALAAVIYDHPEANTAPFMVDNTGFETTTEPKPYDGRWELSSANDHKLFLRGGDTYLFSDRYCVPERAARVRAAIEALGGTVVVASR